MANFQFVRPGRRAFRVGLAAFAVAASALTPLSLRAQEGLGGQAEWRQSYETSERISISRESTPVLSPATVAATDAAIQAYQGIVERGGWNNVPVGPDLRVGLRSRVVQALRQRLNVSGDLDPATGNGPTFDSFVEAGVKRFQLRHGLSPTGVVGEATYAELNVTADTRLQQLQA